jgi:hypothetical protein
MAKPRRRYNQPLNDVSRYIVVVLALLAFYLGTSFLYGIETQTASIPSIAYSD